MLSLSGKVALVTGASRGLGQAIALALGKAGADVVVTDLLIENEAVDKEKMAKEDGLFAAHFAESDNVQPLSTADEIRKMGGRIIGMKMDVTKPDEIQQVISLAADQFGGIDILVNNAGVMDNMALMEKQSGESA